MREKPAAPSGIAPARSSGAASSPTAASAESSSGSGDYRELATAYVNAGWAAILDDQPAEALRLLRLALPPLERVDSPAPLRAALGNMGLASLFAGDARAARAAFEETLRICRRNDFRSGPDTAIAGLAAIAAPDGERERAARLIGAARALGWPSVSDDARIDARLERDFLAAARASCGPTRWAEEERAGAELSYPEAIAYALGDAEPPDDEAGRGRAELSSPARPRVAARGGAR